MLVLEEKVIWKELVVSDNVGLLLFVPEEE